MLRHSSRSFESGLPKKQLIPASSDAAKVYLRMSGLESDAFKRAAMNLGLGLHLWCDDEYFIYNKNKKKGDESTDETKADNS